MNKTRPCRRCGSTVTVQNEGKVFCARCNEQIEEFFEIESEDEAVNASNYARIKTPRRKETGEENVVDDGDDLITKEPGWQKKASQSQRAKKKTVDDENLSKDYLDYLDNMDVLNDTNVGGSTTRIGSFCKILHKLSTMMIVELGFPNTYTEIVRCIMQRYLRECGVAFIDNEYTEDSLKTFKKTTVVKRSKSTIAANLKRLKLEKRKKGVSKLEKSVDAWALLQDANITENFELSSDESDTNQSKEMNMSAREEIRIKETNIDISIKEKAENVYLSVDIVVAILFVSAIRSGCLWVTISDIVRWLREDRGKTFGNLLRFYSHGKTIASNLSFDPLASLILSEYCRVKYWVWQIVDVDTSCFTIPYAQIVARFLYNLNLPTDMMQRVLILMDCAPPSEKLDNIYITQQGDAKDGSSMDSTKHLITGCFGRVVSERRFSNHDVFIGTETKILAYILLALKLVYGLDGINEYKIKSNNFDPIEWTYQLKMRVMLFEGHAVKDVLNETKINYPLTTFATAMYSIKTRNKEGNKAIRVYTTRTQPCETITPSITPCDSAFEQVNPLVVDVADRVNNRNDEDKVYAPIRAQIYQAKTFMNENRSEDDKKRIAEELSADGYKILIKDYGEGRIRISNQADSGSQRNKGKWRKSFPCSEFYSKYPQPEWAHGMLVSIPETNNALRRINLKLRDQPSSLVGLRSMFLSSEGVADLFQTAHHTFSPIFSDVLVLLSKTISEHQHIFYAAFVMIEMQIIDRTSYVSNSKKILECETVPLSYITKTNEAHTSIDCGSVIVSVDEPIQELRELRILRFGAPREWISGICDENNSDSEDEETTSPKAAVLPTKSGSNIQKVAERKVRKKKEGKHVLAHLYDWNTFWQLLTMRYW